MKKFLEFLGIYSIGSAITFIIMAPFALILSFIFIAALVYWSTGINMYYWIF